MRLLSLLAKIVVVVKGYGFVKSKVKNFICPDKNKMSAMPVNVPLLDNHTTSHISRHLGQGWDNLDRISRNFYSWISESNAAGKD